MSTMVITGFITIGIFAIFNSILMFQALTVVNRHGEMIEKWNKRIDSMS